MEALDGKKVNRKELLMNSKKQMQINGIILNSEYPLVFQQQKMKLLKWVGYKNLVKMDGNSRQ